MNPVAIKSWVNRYHKIVEDISDQSPLTNEDEHFGPGARNILNIILSQNEVYSRKIEPWDTIRQELLPYVKGLRQYVYLMKTHDEFREAELSTKNGFFPERRNGALDYAQFSWISLRF